MKINKSSSTVTVSCASNWNIYVFYDKLYFIYIYKKSVLYQKLNVKGTFYVNLKDLF